MSQKEILYNFFDKGCPQDPAHLYNHAAQKSLVLQIFNTFFNRHQNDFRICNKLPL